MNLKTDPRRLESHPAFLHRGQVQWWISLWKNGVDNIDEAFVITHMATEEKAYLKQPKLEVVTWPVSSRDNTIYKTILDGSDGKPPFREQPIAAKPGRLYSLKVAFRLIWAALSSKR